MHHYRSYGKTWTRVRLYKFQFSIFLHLSWVSTFFHCNRTNVYLYNNKALEKLILRKVITLNWVIHGALFIFVSHTRRTPRIFPFLFSYSALRWEISDFHDLCWCSRLVFHYSNAPSVCLLMIYYFTILVPSNLSQNVCLFSTRLQSRTFIFGLNNSVAIIVH